MKIKAFNTEITEVAEKRMTKIMSVNNFPPIFSVCSEFFVFSVLHDLLIDEGRQNA